ncbi:MAG: hypothetical protein GEV06_28780, partial [Luteitalea sp.]|nr:hypothetical protein [Luteitalea sp.]
MFRRSVSIRPSTLRQAQGRPEQRRGTTGLRATLTLRQAQGHPERSRGVRSSKGRFVAVLGILLGGMIAQPSAQGFDFPFYFVEQAKLTASGGAALDHFGSSVAIDGSTVVVGALFADVGGTTNQDAAYVLTRVGDTWTQTAQLTASGGAAGDLFGRSVAINGNTAVVGAPYADVDGNSGQGAAYVFTEAGGNWIQTAQLTASNGSGGD